MDEMHTDEMIGAIIRVARAIGEPRADRGCLVDQADAIAEALEGIAEDIKRIANALEAQHGN